MIKEDGKELDTSDDKRTEQNKARRDETEQDVMPHDRQAKRVQANMSLEPHRYC